MSEKWTKEQLQVYRETGKQVPHSAALGLLGAKKKPRKPRQAKEESLHNIVCMYLDLKFPNVLYITDLSGIKLPMGLAVKAKKQRHKSLKIPDITIVHPSGDYHGLAIEIKNSKSDAYRVDGTLRQEKHIQKQNKTLKHLRSIGYKAEFGCGLDHCRKLIDDYFKHQ